MSANPIPVLHFSNMPVRGGAEEHMLRLLQRLDRKQFQPFLVCPAECLGKLRPDLSADVRAFPLSYESPVQLRAAWRLARILHENKIQIVHSHMFRASLAASPVAWMCRVPVIIETPHVREAWRKGWKASYWIDRLAGRFVSKYIAVSHANAAYLKNEKKLPARKIIVIHNGRDLTHFDPQHRAPEGFKESLGFGEQDPVLTVFARLEPQKGHRVLLEAIPAILREFPSTRLVCLGEGALRGELIEKAKLLGLQNAVRFVGFQSNVADWLAVTTLTVLPSFFEGLPLTAIEALASEVPMVATEVDGTAEVILNSKTGLLVKPGDANALAAAILEMLRDPQRAKSLARAGREWVLREFSEEKQLEETQALYRSALGKCGRTEHSKASTKSGFDAPAISEPAARVGARTHE